MCHDRDFFFGRAEWLWSFCRFAIKSFLGRCGPQTLAGWLEHLRKPPKGLQGGSTSCFRRHQREFPVRKKPLPPILEHDLTSFRSWISVVSIGFLMVLEFPFACWSRAWRCSAARFAWTVLNFLLIIDNLVYFCACQYRLKESYLWSNVLLLVTSVSLLSPRHGGGVVDLTTIWLCRVLWNCENCSYSRVLVFPISLPTFSSWSACYNPQMDLPLLKNE